MVDVCATPATQLYFSQPASTAFPAGYASCTDSTSGEALASCIVSNSPCRYSLSQTNETGVSVDFVVCVAYNSTSQCDREYMADCGVVATVTAEDSSTTGDAASNLALTNITSSDGSATSQDASTGSTTTAGIIVDTPMLVAIIAGCIVVLGSIFFMAYVIRSRRGEPRGSGGQKSDSDTDFVEVLSAAGDDDLSPQPHELSSIVLPMRPTLSQVSPHSRSSSSYLASTPQRRMTDETPVIRFPSQASFFRGGSSIMTGRSVFSASVLNHGGAAVYAQRQLSSLFGPRASRESTASVIQPIHSRTTATAIRVTSPPSSLTDRAHPLYSWETPVATVLDANRPTFFSGRRRAVSDTNWSIGPGTESQDSMGDAGDFALHDRPTALASRLSVALEAMSPRGLPNSLDDVDSLARSDGSDSVFDSGCTLFSTDSDYYGETIRDQSAAIFVVDADDTEDDKEIEF
jgi:hypothetical protein